MAFPIIKVQIVFPKISECCLNGQPHSNSGCYRAEQWCREVKVDVCGRELCWRRETCSFLFLFLFPSNIEAPLLWAEDMTLNVCIKSLWRREWKSCDGVVVFFLSPNLRSHQEQNFAALHHQLDLQDHMFIWRFWDHVTMTQKCTAPTMVVPVQGFLLINELRSAGIH